MGTDVSLTIQHRPNPRGPWISSYALDAGIGVEPEERNYTVFAHLCGVRNAGPNQPFRAFVSAPLFKDRLDGDPGDTGTTDYGIVATLAELRAVPWEARTHIVNGEEERAGLEDTGFVRWLRGASVDAVLAQWPDARLVIEFDQ